MTRTQIVSMLALAVAVPVATAGVVPLRLTVDARPALLRFRQYRL